MSFWVADGVGVVIDLICCKSAMLFCEFCLMSGVPAVAHQA